MLPLDELLLPPENTEPERDELLPLAGAEPEAELPPDGAGREEEPDELLPPEKAGRALLELPDELPEKEGREPPEKGLPPELGRLPPEKELPPENDERPLDELPENEDRPPPLKLEPPLLPLPANAVSPGKKSKVTASVRDIHRRM